MSAEPEQDPSCDVCGRRLLPGERSFPYVTRDGAAALVCELCKPRAEASGWLRPDEADELRMQGTSRERRRPRGQVLSGLLSRLPSSASGGRERETADRREEATDDERSSTAPQAGRRASRRPPAAPDAPVERPPRHEPQPEPQPEPELHADVEARRPPAEPAPAESAGIGIPEALAAFNATDHRRTVAGLTRTLGPPRATALPIRAGDGSPATRLTVAWELTWYQWEVSSGGRGIEVRESGKGETIDQLGAPDRAWNLLADPSGSLEQRTPPAAVPEPASDDEADRSER